MNSTGPTRNYRMKWRNVWDHVHIQQQQKLLLILCKNVSHLVHIEKLCWSIPSLCSVVPDKTIFSFWKRNANDQFQYQYLWKLGLVVLGQSTCMAGTPDMTLATSTQPRRLAWPWQQSRQRRWERNIGTVTVALLMRLLTFAPNGLFFVHKEMWKWQFSPIDYNDEWLHLPDSKPPFWTIWPRVWVKTKARLKKDRLLLSATMLTTTWQSCPLRPVIFFVLIVL